MIMTINNMCFDCNWFNMEMKTWTIDIKLILDQMRKKSECVQREICVEAEKLGS